MKNLNLRSQGLTAGAYEGLNLIEEAASLCRMGKSLRVKSEELRRRNIRVVHAADAAAKRGFQVSFEIFEVTMEMRFALDSQ